MIDYYLPLTYGGPRYYSAQMRSYTTRDVAGKENGDSVYVYKVE